ncbi:fructuronate reductase [Propionispira arboris]|uniref:Fructuronate reductase n=1 Tax=Propionispira arboris TaxID=84035 RepID=A0A1H6ZMH0_9FIRM|nr:mannitol dehydrogenase family protein [Propionispira arboris]SEJ50780.1 fructuronate reductase [Propionispira arboris]
MKLNVESMQDVFTWKSKGIALPEFDRSKMLQETAKNPSWLHFGPGNIFRAFIASLQQNLLNQGAVNTGIIVAATNTREIIEKIYQPHDNLNLLVTLYPDQTTRKTVIGSIAESLTCRTEEKADWERLQEILCRPSLQIMSFTITEKGYKIKAKDDTYLPDIAADLLAGPKAPQSFLARVVSLLYERYIAGACPLTLLSLDNCSQNGLVLKKAVQEIAQNWEQTGLVKAGFMEYLRQQVAYPCSMIDKITPRPSEKIQKELLQDGFTDMEFISSQRGGCYAPFVNAEKTEYLVVEDTFLNGRPPLEKAGVIFTNRQTVDCVEKMKVCTCLNPLHTALAVFGCLLGYTLIADEMKNPLLYKLVENIGYQEGMKVVADPGVLNPQDFLRECLTERFPNPAIPDTPQRIACDTSQKLGIRFGETIKAYQKSPDLDVKNLTYIPLTIAGWCRYLLGLDDSGNSFTVSPDPLLEELQGHLADVHFGTNMDVHAALKTILSDPTIFGLDLYKIGLGDRIEVYFKEMITGPEAVQKTLRKYLG